MSQYTKEAIPDFIIIDDEPISNYISCKAVQQVFPDANITGITSPEYGLGYLRSNYDKAEANKVVLFLDIHMPALSGWNVLDVFTDYPELLRSRCSIFMLSSSEDPADLEKEKNSPLTAGYITKPLKPDMVKSTFSNLLTTIPAPACLN
jgi:CheY-like chemotaxis protein